MRTRFPGRAARQRRNASDPSRAGQGLAAAGGRAGRPAGGEDGIGARHRHAFGDADVYHRFGGRPPARAFTTRARQPRGDVRWRPARSVDQRTRQTKGPARAGPWNAAAAHGRSGGRGAKAGKTGRRAGRGARRAARPGASAGRPARRIRTACGCRSSARAGWSRRAWTRPCSRRAGACSRRRGTARCASTGGRTPSRTAFP